MFPYLGVSTYMFIYINQIPSLQSYGFSSSQYECESWTIRKRGTEELMLLNWGVGEDSWVSLGLQEIKPVNTKGNQSWIFSERTDTEAEVPILWPSDTKNWFIGKDPDARKDWRREEKKMAEDEMVGWHHKSMDMSLSKLQKMVEDRRTWCTAVHEVSKTWVWLSYWT